MDSEDRDMKIVYDKRADALNIILKRGKVHRTVEIAPEVLVDFDKAGNPLYLEVIGASEKLGKRNFREVAVGRKTLRLPAVVS